MSTLLRVTGIKKTLSFFRYIYFNGPRVTQWSAIALILAVGLIHLVLVPEHFEAAPYLGFTFVAVFLASGVGAAGIFWGSWWAGWTPGAVLCAAAFVAYILSRALGLPGFSEAVGAWDTPAGTVAAAVEALYVGLYVSVAVGMNVAHPQRREWHD